MMVINQAHQKTKSKLLSKANKAFLNMVPNFLTSFFLLYSTQHLYASTSSNYLNKPLFPQTCRVLPAPACPEGTFSLAVPSKL